MSTQERTVEFNETFPQRFFSKILKTDGCWEWQGNRNNMGYGMCRPRGADQPKWPCHVLMWIYTHGTIPAGMHVLHRCDNAACVRPDHLWLGTHADNMKDKHAKNRAYPQSWLSNIRAAADRRRKLTPEQGAEAKWLHENGAPLRAIARYFKCDRDAIRVWLR